jgi:K+-transporting ATPase ATPase C chain
VKKQFITSILMTLATTILLGILYPLLVTGLAQVFFPAQANGELIHRGETIVGSHLLGQPFTDPGYFHSRPSASGDAGYDPTASGGSTLGPTNQKLVDRVNGDVARLQKENPGTSVPIDLVTASGSGLDPDITPAAAEFQVARVANERGMPEEAVRSLVRQHTQQRQLGLLGEPRVNVLDLNLDLDSHATH